MSEFLKDGAAYQGDQVCSTALVELLGLETLGTQVIEDRIESFEDVATPDALHRSRVNVEEFSDLDVVEPACLLIGLEEDAGMSELAGGCCASLEERLEVLALLAREVHRVLQTSR